MPSRRSGADDRLSTYRGMRDFDRTAEPAGGTADEHEGRRRFVVQRHRASSRHYDLRFEIDGVLASWAVPKGPTLDPSVKRMAIQVEDHPLEYAAFEGVIPQGEYGGGDVIVWDQGTWEPHDTDDPAAAVAAGELHADVYGEKLRGRLVLVRRGSDDGDQQSRRRHRGSRSRAQPSGMGETCTVHRVPLSRCECNRTVAVSTSSCAISRNPMVRSCAHATMAVMVTPQ